MGQPLGKAVRQFLKKLSIELPYGPPSQLLVIYPNKNLYTEVHRRAITIAKVGTKLSISW